LSQPRFDRRRSVLREETHDALDHSSGGSRPALRGVGADDFAADLQSGRRTRHDAGSGALGDAGDATDRRAEHPTGADRTFRGRRRGVGGQFDAEFLAVERSTAQRQLGNRPDRTTRRRFDTVAAQSVAVAAAFAGFLAVACAAPAHAQPAPVPTILHLSETATVPAHPDELAASIRAEAVAASPADAQQRVNVAVSAALKRAREINGVTVSTGNYSVWRIGPTAQDHTERWEATQTIALHSRDGTPLLTLVGELQQKGLALSQLSWQLSDETSRAARQQALAAALKALRGRADEAAALIGLQFDQFKEVRLDTPRPQPMPRMMMAAPASAKGFAPPSAEAEPEMVSATAEADVLLKPR
jgi:predicted secreted protein